MNTKTCSRCGADKPLDGNFYRDARSVGGYMQQCIECKREVQRHYAHTEPGRQVMFKKDTRKKIVEPDKQDARNKLRNAVRLGKIEKPNTCDRCQTSDSLIEGHHADYSKPFEVDWLCSRCHHAAHKHLVATGGDK